MRTLPVIGSSKRNGAGISCVCPGMDRLKLILVIVGTAVITAALTSAFWLVAFNRGRIAEPARPAAPAASPSAAPAPAARAPLVVTPSGLAIPVAGVKPEQLVDTYDSARAN